jgi:hypothetical protein
MVAAVNGLPANARLFGYGWWQAPVLALYSGRQMEDISRWSNADVLASPESYLIVAREMQELYPLGIDQVRQRFILVPVRVTPAGSIYRIDAANGAPP